MKDAKGEYYSQHDSILVASFSGDSDPVEATKRKSKDTQPVKKVHTCCVRMITFIGAHNSIQSRVLENFIWSVAIGLRRGYQRMHAAG